MHPYFFQIKLFLETTTATNNYILDDNECQSLTPDLHDSDEEFFDAMDAFNDVQVEEAVANRII
ncbi:7616_t:CDS:2 [Ambispora gerdemannii]|uniref:7616_t:CDS:1 n=1 Tax=Ambispora gerdemannii TaxID=144530 RepID=A0A9N9ATA4_9GLOM|nr:7616_t:CDS:2 [Ambispora gerdemannii]